MQSINDIHATIQAEYRRLQSEHESAANNARDMLYASFPRIEEIDREIASLAINNAKSVLEEKISPEEAAERIKLQADVLRQEKRNIITKYNIRQYQPQYNCELCSDTGYRENSKKCGCYMKKLRDALALPGEKSENVALKNSSFNKFELSYYPSEVDPTLGISPRDIMRVVFADCTTFASSFSGEEDGNLLLCGPSGLGKTLLAASVANSVTDKGYLVIYKSSYKLFQFMEDYKFGKISRDVYDVTYEAIYDCDLLVIDDFGTEFITSYTQSVFFDLLSTRLSSGKSTVISTNLPLEKIAEIYQERVMSRLKNEFRVLRFAGNDIRALKNNK